MFTVEEANHGGFVNYLLLYKVVVVVAMFTVEALYYNSTVDRAPAHLDPFAQLS